MKNAHKTNAARFGWLAMTAATFLVASAYGCSSSSSAAGDDSSGGDGGGGGDSTTGGDSSTSNNPYTGVVTVTQDLTSGTYTSSLQAYFFQTSTSPSCTTTVSGACTFVDCTASLYPDGGQPQATYVQAGTMSISGGKLAQSTSVPFDTSTSVGQYFLLKSTQLFAPGDTFTVTATGQDVAAFTGTSSPAPADITLSAPLPTTNLGTSVWTINEAQDLTVTWTGGSAGAETKVVLENESGAVELVCAFDAAAGTGTVPNALLTQVGANDGTGTGVGGASTFSITPESKTTLSVSNANVLFSVTGSRYYGSFKTQ